jgi:hypothetical protein
MAGLPSTATATRSLPALSLEAAAIASEAAQKRAKDIGIGTLLAFSYIDRFYTTRPSLDARWLLPLDAR